MFVQKIRGPVGNSTYYLIYILIFAEISNEGLSKFTIENLLKAVIFPANGSFGILI